MFPAFFLREFPDPITVFIYALMLLGFGPLVLQSGIVWPWFMAGTISAILFLGPLDNSRFGTWVREGGILGFAGMIAILSLVFVTPVLYFGASTGELLNLASGGILGVLFLIIATVLYTRVSTGELP
ncbi:hypothetical protein Halru_0173 [Halovivax ruber XH-70]|uniref:Uncharacterized protein n=1 Tax=Halovivax ruber (strain DSM 18193 / JCM 13892 / XH-70) TaxID=797302 RepID=L0I5P1_HALRX|nr:hypothetical protein Halru_0173 [Halovivax ruber XH-70]